MTLLGLVAFAGIIGAFTLYRLDMLRQARRRQARRRWAPFNPTTGALFEAMLSGGRPSADGPFSHTFTPAEPEVLEVRITPLEMVRDHHEMTLETIWLRQRGFDPNAPIYWWDDEATGDRVIRQVVHPPALTVEDIS